MPIELTVFQQWIASVILLSILSYIISKTEPMVYLIIEVISLLKQRSSVRVSFYSWEVACIMYFILKILTGYLSPCIPCMSGITLHPGSSLLWISICAWHDLCDSGPWPIAISYPYACHVGSCGSKISPHRVLVCPCGSLLLLMKAHMERPLWGPACTAPIRTWKLNRGNWLSTEQQWATLGGVRVGLPANVGRVMVVGVVVHGVPGLLGDWLIHCGCVITGWQGEGELWHDRDEMNTALKAHSPSHSGVAF